MSSAAGSGYKVAVLGAAGGIGQPLSLLLKTDPRIGHLSLYDIVNTPGVGADISHVCSPSKVTAHTGADELGAALRDMDIIIIPAGVPRKPGMTRDDLFNTNASIVRDLIRAGAENARDPFYLIISNPVNSTVPIAAEVLKQAGVYNPKRLMGVTTLDVVRANTFVAERAGKNPTELDVTVVGGHAGTTILPLLSQIPGVSLSDEDVAELTHRIQFGGDEVVKAKDGAGSATLSMAYAAWRFAGRLMSALDGESGVRECAFVESPVAGEECPFFSSRVLLTPEGVSEISGLGELTEFEQKAYEEMLPALTAQVNKGIEFANKSK